jgi:hypothetical protein
MNALVDVDVFTPDYGGGDASMAKNGSRKQKSTSWKASGGCFQSGFKTI